MTPSQFIIVHIYKSDTQIQILDAISIRQLLQDCSKKEVAWEFGASPTRWWQMQPPSLRTPLNCPENLIDGHTSLEKLQQQFT